MGHCHASSINGLLNLLFSIIVHPKQYYHYIISLGRSVRLPETAGALETETHPSAGRGGPGGAPGRAPGRATGAFVTSLLSVVVSVESSVVESSVESSPSSARFHGGSSGDGGRGGVSGQSEA